VTDLIYIMAASHSGSTLLTMLLGGHPQVCTVGELKATDLGDVETYKCSCREPIKQCPFWNAVSEGMAKRGIDFQITNAGTDYRSNGSGYTRRLLQPLHRGPLLEAVRGAALWLSPTWRRRLPEIQARNAALAETVCELCGAQAVVDSSKIANRLKYLLRNPALRVKVIRLIRDGRGAALAYIRERRDTIEQAATEWRRSNEEAENLLAGIDPSICIEARYEDLCADPKGTLKRLYEFIGVNSDELNCDFRSYEHHVVGNYMRLGSSHEIKLDEEWRTLFTADQIARFDRISGALNRRYGYQ